MHYASVDNTAQYKQVNEVYKEKLKYDHLSYPQHLTIHSKNIIHKLYL